MESRRSMKPPTHHAAWKWIALLAGTLALVRAGASVRTFNHTTDELAHIAAAVGLIESGNNLYMVEHPPLQRLWVGWVLESAGVEYAPARGLSEIPRRVAANQAGADIAYNGRIPYWNLLVAARLANLLFAALLLTYIYKLGRYLANPLAGALATLFFSTEPNFLAHAALVTTDVPAAAGFVAASYYALRFVARPTRGRTIAAGVALGLAMACKFTCILLAPPILLLIALRGWRSVRNRKHGRSASIAFWRKVPRLHRLAAIALIAFLALWSTYLFSLGKLSNQDLFTNEATWNRIPAWAKDITLPMPAMPLGVGFMLMIGKNGFPTYLNGHIDLQGKLYYFPEALALKSPVGFLADLALACLLWTFSRRKRPQLSLCLLLCPSLLMAAAMTSKLQIGVRHILPVIPFLYVLAAIHLHRGLKSLAAAACIAAAAVETARIHPDYLAFFNQIKGGPDKGSLYLADSNLDWGQDIARLAQYLKSIDARQYVIKVSGAQVDGLLRQLQLDPASRAPSSEDLRANPRGLLAIGVNARLRLEGAARDPDGQLILGPDWSWLKDYPVIKRIGRTIDIYNLDRRLDNPPAADPPRPPAE